METHRNREINRRFGATGALFDRMLSISSDGRYFTLTIAATAIAIASAYQNMLEIQYDSQHKLPAQSEQNDTAASVAVLEMDGLPWQTPFIRELLRSKFSTMVPTAYRRTPYLDCLDFMSLCLGW